MRQTTQIIEKIGKLLSERIEQANICCMNFAETLETVDLANVNENARGIQLKQLLNKLHDVFKRERNSDSGAKLAKLISEASLKIFRKMSPYFEVGEFIKPSGLTGLVDLYLCYWTYTRDMRSAMLLKSFHSSNPSNYIFSLKFILKQLLDTTHAYYLQKINAATSSTNSKDVEQFRNKRAVTSTEKSVKAENAEQRFLMYNNWRINGNQFISSQLKELVKEKKSATKICRLVKKLAVSNQPKQQEGNYQSFFISCVPPRILSAGKPETGSTQISIEKYKSQGPTKMQKPGPVLSISNPLKHCYDNLQVSNLTREKGCKSTANKDFKRIRRNHSVIEIQKTKGSYKIIRQKENINTADKIIEREKLLSAERVTSKQKVQLMKNNYNLMDIDQVRLYEMADQKNFGKVFQQVTNRNRKKLRLSLKMKQTKKA